MTNYLLTEHRRFETDELENTELTHEEKIKYLQMAFGIISGFKSFDFKTLDMIVSLSDLIDTKKGGTDLQSICEVKKIVDKRAENNSLPEGYQANKQ